MDTATNLASTQLAQPQRGYRFSADSVALAEFAQASPAEAVLDLGAGCGVIPILMCLRSPFRYAVGVEVESELVSLARMNVAQFRLGDKIRILQTDLRILSSDALSRIFPRSSSWVDVVTSNPPYWPANRGRLNPSSQKAAARHEILLTLAELLAAARRFLRPGGRFYLSHLESREKEIVDGLEQNSLKVVRVQRVAGIAGRLLFEAHLNEFHRAAFR